MLLNKVIGNKVKTKSSKNQKRKMWITNRAISALWRLKYRILVEKPTGVQRDISLVEVSLRPFMPKRHTSDTMLKLTHIFQNAQPIYLQQFIQKCTLKRLISHH
jgi:hypothetical protein